MDTAVVDQEQILKEAVVESVQREPLTNRMIIVRRIKNPQSFSRQFTEVGVNLNLRTNQKEESAGNKYDEDVLPTSRDTFRPLYSNGRKIRLIEISDTPTIGKLSMKELQEEVKRARLTVQEGPQKGTMITEASIYAEDDPFFCHEQLERTHMEGDLFLDLTQPIDKVVYYCMLATDEYCIRGKLHEKAIPSRVKYELFSQDDNQDDSLKGVSERRKMYQRLDVMNRAELMRIANIFNLKIDDRTADETMRDQIGLLLDDNTKMVPGMQRTYGDWFKVLLSEKAELLEIKEAIHLAINRNVIQKTRSGYMFENEPLGSTKGMVENYLMRGDKQDVLVRVKEVLAFKQLDSRG